MRIKKVTSNQAKRHFTIYLIDGTKYRTCQFSKNEFQNNEFNTLNDWTYFLRSQDFYYVIK